MQLRTFLARDMKAALSSVRAEMGSEAVIVASEKAKGGGVIVRAAIDTQAREETVIQEQVPETIAPILDFESLYRESLVKRLRGDRGGKPDPRRFNRAELLGILHAHRLPDDLSHSLAEGAEKTALSDMTLALASALDKRATTNALDLASAHAILLAGPHGVGKTAVAAKIAAHGLLAGRAVRLIAADPQGAGAVARLQSFADHLNVPLIVADSAQGIAKAVTVAVAEKSLAIIDTAGFDPRNARARSANAALAQIEHTRTVAVLSALADAQDSAEMACCLGEAGAKQLIITGLDLARRFGAIAAASMQGLGLAHVTRSPFVAGGLETLTPLALARALLGPEQRSAQ